MENSNRLLAPARPAVGRLALGWPARLRIWDWRGVLALPLATFIGFLVRLAHVLPAGFPLNDGGLFYVMVQDLQHAHYVLPAHTSYNGADIPFAYPPLPFHIAALLASVGPWSLQDVFRFLPLVFSTLTIPAFFLLSRSMLPSRFMAIVAVFAFALLPRSFNWEIVGGGLTRSLGFLLALLALHQGYLLYTRRRTRFVLTTAALASLAILSHLEMGWLVAYSLALFLVAFGRDARSVRHSVLLAALVLVMTAPWWATVIARYGAGPLLSAAQAGGHTWYSWGLARLIRFDFTEEPFLPLLAALGLLGVLACLADRRFLLPAWLAAMFILDPRKASTNAMVPLAMLIAIGVTSVLLRRPNSGADDEGAGMPDPVRGAWPPLVSTFSLLAAWLAAMLVVDPRRGLTSAMVLLGMLVAVGLVANALLPRTGKGTDDDPDGSAWPRRELRGPWPPLALGLLLVYAAVSAIGTSANASSPLHALSPGNREAMAWVAADTAPTSRFLVVKGSGSPWTDAASEWFPALAQRVSVATVQGYEWLGKGEYERQQARYEGLQMCARRSAGCLRAWARKEGAVFTHVYLPKGEGGDCCAPLRRSLRASPLYRLVYDGPGATVFALSSPAWRP
ncbi:MAG TPA: hypothetical protein VFT91_00495 [Dehalococcoidia bacterium]|nr:hypothetical protein [Dehalococcoidia bacterium]